MCHLTDHQSTNQKLPINLPEHESATIAGISSSSSSSSGGIGGGQLLHLTSAMESLRLAEPSRSTIKSSGLQCEPQISSGSKCRATNKIRMAYLFGHIQILLLVLSSQPLLLAIEIPFSQREPGEATSSLIQVSGLLANSNTSEANIQQQQSTILTLNAGATTTGNTSTANNFSSPQQANGGGDDRPLLIAIMTANVVIFIIGFIGNSVVILVILKFTRIETVTDIYILNLAVADLMFTTGLIFLITTMFIGDWIFGYLMCKLYMASTSLNQFASSLLLVVMSFDRYLAVCHPIYAQRFRRLQRAKIICLCIWIVCLILMSPIFAFAKISKDLTCAIFWPEYKNFNCEVAFTMYSFAIGFAVPLLLIGAFYVLVIRKLRVAASGRQTLGSSRRSRSRENTNRRIEHLVIGIICTYTICWLPYWMTQLCVSFSTNNKLPVPGFYGIFLTASSLSYTNSALNPILYAFLSDNFKRRCSDILRSIYSFKLFQNCTKASKGAHSYQAPLPTTTTGCCETELARHDLRSTLYLGESVRFIPASSNNHHSAAAAAASGGSHNNRATSAAPEAPGQLEPPEDSGDETGSSTVAPGSLNTSHGQRKKSVNFSPNTDIIRSSLKGQDVDGEPKSYHQIHCDSGNQRQDV